MAEKVEKSADGNGEFVDPTDQYADYKQDVPAEDADKGEVSEDGFAEYKRAKVDAAPNADENRSVDELVSESSAAQIKYLVESGELKAEDVYAAEGKGKKRSTVLADYKPAEGDGK